MSADLGGGEPVARRRPQGRLDRAVGLVIVGLAGTGAIGLLVVAAAGGALAQRPPREGLVFGVWAVLYDTEAPSLRVLLMAAALALVCAAGVALMERRVTNRSRRSFDRSSKPLAPKVIMAATQGVFAGPVTITVLIPAHNEEACIGATIASLQAQSEQPQRIVVVADNCTDATKQIALAAGVECFETVGNSQKKAGALNQALSSVLPGQGDNDLVMGMDADTVLDAGFLAAAAQR